MSLPLATSSTLPRASRASTTALPGRQGPSGIPEVPSSGLPSPPTSPPLAALNSSTNELALLPKQKKSQRAAGASHYPGSHLQGSRRGGAGISIREECERFFCEPMQAVFLGERGRTMHGSGLTGVFNNNNGNNNGAGSDNAGAYLLTPPPDGQFPVGTPPGMMSSRSEHETSAGTQSRFEIDAWMELWDYAGGASFRAFIANDGEERSLFVFFDIEGVQGRDLKKALMALIELADGPLDCSHVVTCLDRRIPGDETLELTRSLQWVGFEMTTLDHWAQDLDVTSKQWMFMGMEI